MAFRSRILPTAILCLTFLSAGNAYAQQYERLGASRITARYGHRGMVRFGLPRRNGETAFLANIACGALYGEKISREGPGVWVSRNVDLKTVNWVCWDPDPLGDEKGRDKLTPLLKNGEFKISRLVWKSVIDECIKWAAEPPMGFATIVCGPIIGREGEPPQAWFAAICKKTGLKLGWKSIAFLIPNKESADGAAFKYSESVNALEHQSGWDLFCKLPAGVQELVEEMTVYELFCPFQEQDEEYEREMEQEFFEEYLEPLDKE